MGHGCENGADENLTKTPDRLDSNASWSPDGQWIAFLRSRTLEPGETIERLVKRLTSRPVLIDSRGVNCQAVNEWPAGGFSWSPDGRRIIYTDAERGARHSLLHVPKISFWGREKPVSRIPFLLMVSLILLTACRPQLSMAVTPTPTFGRDTGTTTCILQPEPLVAECTPTAVWSSYSSPRYEVSLQYPAHWQKAPGYSERFEGKEGFFALSAASGGVIDEVAKLSAEHKLQPYGSRPTIESLQIQGLEARLILPSEDQPADMRGQSELIVRYPQPVRIDRSTYRFFVLWGDKDHIRAIAQTLRFRIAASTLEPSSSPSVLPTPTLGLRLSPTVMPTLSPVADMQKYEDRWLCFAVEVPAGWIADGVPGGFALFMPETDQNSFNITNVALEETTLAQALAEVKRGSLGAYVQEVKDFTVGGQPALWVTLSPDNPDSSGIKLVVMVIAPDCGDGAHALFISATGADQGSLEAFLNYVRFIQGDY